MVTMLGFFALIAVLAPLLVGTVVGLALVGVAMAGRLAATAKLQRVWKLEAA
jgi:hypothetical protein